MIIEDFKEQEFRHSNSEIECESEDSSELEYQMK